LRAKDAIFLFAVDEMQVIQLNNAKDAKYSARCGDFVGDARVGSFVYS